VREAHTVKSATVPLAVGVFKRGQNPSPITSPSPSKERGIQGVRLKWEMPNRYIIGNE